MADGSLADGVEDAPRTVRARFDWSVTAPTAAVVEAVAVATDRAPLDVCTLHEAIDTDALDALVRSGDPSGHRVSFTYGGCDVTVHGDGRLRVTLLDEE